MLLLSMSMVADLGCVGCHPWLHGMIPAI